MMDLLRQIHERPGRKARGVVHGGVPVDGHLDACNDLRHWPAHVDLLRFAPCLHRPGPPIVRSAALRPGRLTLRLLRAGFKPLRQKDRTPPGRGSG
ncbi:hypothetical protein G6F65_017693 [Rhizopus arrhizus]|nr:hypothetical protein G6F65_017693 [Rhizopus arrhizus]